MVPYAVEVDGHIITVFDPVVHRPLPCDDDMLDPRWVLCERPCITVGGELSAAMLELRLDEATRVFISPCQMKANNGILIIDDFGRQVLSPRELLNRWIVPLDRRVDYLTLASGMKFQVPFELMVVFSTNLNPTTWPTRPSCAAFRPRCWWRTSAPTSSTRSSSAWWRRIRCRREPGSAEYLRERCLAAGDGSARLLPDGHLPAGKAISEYERPAGAHDARQHRPRGRPLLRQVLNSRTRLRFTYILRLLRCIPESGMTTLV